VLESGGKKISNGNCLYLNEEMTQEDGQMYQDYGTTRFRQISVQVNNKGGKNCARFRVFIVWNNPDDVRTFRNIMGSLK
jgi:hypothetical protein